MMKALRQAIRYSIPAAIFFKPRIGSGLREHQGM